MTDSIGLKAKKMVGWIIVAVVLMLPVLGGSFFGARAMAIVAVLVGFVTWLGMGVLTDAFAKAGMSPTQTWSSFASGVVMAAIFSFGIWTLALLGVLVRKAL